MKKKLVIITGHPETDSLCHANAQALKKGGEKQNLQVTVLNAYDFPIIKENPLKEGFPKPFDKAVKALQDADYVAVVCPMWNFSIPGMLKNFFDGVIQSGELFRFEPLPGVSALTNLPVIKTLLPGARPKGLLKARKALCVWTADGPGWYYRIFWWKNQVFEQLRTMLEYCGIMRVHQRMLPMTRKSTKKQRESWLQKLETYHW